MVIFVLPLLKVNGGLHKIFRLVGEFDYHLLLLSVSKHVELCIANDCRRHNDLSSVAALEHSGKAVRCSALLCVIFLFIF